MLKKTAITLLLIILFFPLQAADRFFIGPGNWNATSSWSATSGGATGASVPGASDIAYFDANSNNCTITATLSVAGIDSTGFTNTITQNAVTVTVGASGINWVSGTFSGSASTITSNGGFVQTGGVFTATSGTFTTSGNITFASGTFNPNNGTVNINGVSTITSGVFYRLTLAINGIVTITNNAIVNNNFTISSIITINGDAIEAKGNIIFTDTSWNGSSKIIVNGTGTQNFTGNGVCGVTMDVNKPSGVASLGGNRTFLGAGVDLNLIAGNFDCNDKTLTISRNFVISGGVFNPGTGTVIYNGVNVDIVDGNFFNLTLYNTNQVLTITNNLIVNNTLNTSRIKTINGDAIEAKGDVIFTDTSWNGTSKMIISGTGTQTFTGAGVCGVQMDVNKVSGTVELGANCSLLGVASDLNLISGAFNCNDKNLTLGRNLVITGGTINTGTSTVIFTGTAVNIIDGNFYNLTLNKSTLVLTLTNNTIVNNTLTFQSVATINGADIEAKGDIVFTDTGRNGSSHLIVNGTGDQNISGVGDVDRFEINKVSGDLIFNSNVVIYTGVWTHTAGNIVWNGHTVTCNATPVTIVNGNFYDLTLNASTLVTTITNNTIVNNTLTIASLATLNGAAIEAKGDIVYTDTSWTGSSTIIANGTGDQNISGVGEVSNFDINKVSGDLIFNSDLNINVGVWTHTAGNIVWNNHTVTCNGASATIVNGNFYNLTLNASTLVVTLTNSTIVNNNLVVSALVTLNGSPLEVKGDITFTDTSWAGSSAIQLTGTAVQRTVGGGICGVSMTTNKPSGSYVLMSNLNIVGAGNDFTVYDGELNLDGFNITVADLFTVYDKLKLIGNENIKVNNVSNSIATTNPKFTISATSSTIEYFDSAVIATVTSLSSVFYNLELGSGKTHEFNFGAGNGVTVNGNFSSNGDSLNPSVLRSVGDMATEWELNLVGTSTFTDNVSVKYCNASDGAELLAVGSLDAGNNQNWVFVSTSIVSISSATANGLYSTGSAINVTIDFSRPITLIGTMTVNLNSGGSVIIPAFTNATQASGNYTVGSGQTSSDLNVTSISVLGTAKDVSSIDLSLALPIANLAVNKDIIVDALTPTITSIYSTSSNGNYSTGSLINVTLNFSEAVTLVGTLSVNLDTGGVVAISSFANATTASGVYTVLNGHASFDLDSTSIVLSGSFSDIASNVVSLIMPGSTIASNSNIVIDTSSPTISSIQSLTADGSYREGQSINFLITFSENVTSSGTLSLGLTSGGSVAFGPFAGTSTTGIYTVLAGENTSLLNGNSIAMVSGSILDDSNNSIFLAIPSSNVSPLHSIQIDTIAPTILSSALASGNGTIDITFSENIFNSNVALGALDLTDFDLTFAANGGSASGVSLTGISNILGGALVGGEATVRLSFSIIGTVSGSETISIQLVANSVFDTAGNPALSTETTGSVLLFDQLAPSITNITSLNVNGPYKTGAIIFIKVTFDEVVIVTGAPMITLETGAVDRTAIYSSGSASSDLIFTYTVQDGDLSSDLEYSSTTALGLNGGLITDSSLINASLVLPAMSLTGSLSFNKNIVIDTTAPKITGGSIGANNAFVDVFFSEPVYTAIGTGALTIADLQLIFNQNSVNSSGAVITSLKTISGNTLIGGEMIVRVNMQVTGVPIGLETVTLLANEDELFDLPGNVMPAIETTNAISLINKGTVPKINKVSVVDPDGVYGTASVLTIAIQFSEPVFVTGVPYLSLETGAIDGFGFYNSGDGTNTLFFKYSIKDGDQSDLLDYVGSSSLISGNTIIKGATGILANVTLPEPGTIGSIAVNSQIEIKTVEPIITGFSTTISDGTYSSGFTIPIVISFSKSVELLSGEIIVELNSGAFIRISHVIGNVINTNYIIKNGEASSDLDILSISLSENGVVQDSSGGDLDLTMPKISFASTHDIQIKNSKAEYLISASSSGNGLIVPSGETLIRNGENKGFSFIPAEGFYLADVVVDGNSVGSVLNYAFINLKADHTIEAKFSKIGGDYQIMANAGFGGSLSPSGIINLQDGSDLKFNFIADPGYHISNIKIDEVSIGTFDSYTLTNIQNDHNVMVTFTKDQSAYLLTSNKIGEGEIFPLGHQSVIDGADITYQFKAASGFHLRNIIVDGESFGALPEFTFSNVINHHLITAVFEKTEDNYLISASAIGGGNISPFDLIKVHAGDSKRFDFTANVGFHLVEVIIDGESKGILKNFTFTNINENHSIVAIYYETKETYSVFSSINNVNGGVVSRLSNSDEVGHGKSYVLSITAEPGYEINSVKANNKYLFGENKQSVNLKNFKDNASTVTFSLPFVVEDYLVGVEFENIKSEYTINMNILGQGIADAPSSITVEKDAFKAISFKALEGNHLSQVIVNGNAIGPIEYLAFTNINSNQEVTAVFSKTDTKYNVNGSVTGNGKISPSGANVVEANGVLSFQFTPDDGYQLVDILIDNFSIQAGEGVGKKESFAFTNVNSDHTIDAVFAKISDNYSITTNVSAGGETSSENIVNVNAGDSHYIQFLPKSGYHVADVKINGVSIGATSSYLFSNVNRDQRVDVFFEVDAISYQIIVTNEGNGVIEPSEMIKVNIGNNQLIEFKPDAGYRVLNITINGESLGPITSYLFKNVLKNQEVIATFTEMNNTFSINAEIVGDGEISPVGVTAIVANSSMIYTIQENQNAEIIDVKVDGISYGAISSYTFTDIDSNHTIQVIFSEVKDSKNTDENYVSSRKGGGCQFAINASHSGLFELLLFLILLLLMTKIIKRRITN